MTWMPSVTIALYRLITDAGLTVRPATSLRSLGSAPAAPRNVAAAAFSSRDALAVTGPDALMLSTTRSAWPVASCCF